METGTDQKEEILNHTYLEKGDYEVKLGLIVRNNKTGVIREACAVKPVKILRDKTEKAEFDKREIKPCPVINILDYDQAKTSNMFSAEKNISQDVVYRVEIKNSKIRLAHDDKAFTNLPAKYAVKENYLPGEKIYSYSIDEEPSLMATYPTFSEITGLGFELTRIIQVSIDDPAAKELNNLEKVFGVSTDVFFRKNDFSLTDAGTQLLDLVLGFLSKYPAFET